MYKLSPQLVSHDSTPIRRARNLFLDGQSVHYCCERYVPVLEKEILIVLTHNDLWFSKLNHAFDIDSFELHTYRNSHPYLKTDIDKPGTVICPAINQRKGKGKPIFVGQRVYGYIENAVLRHLSLLIKQTPDIYSTQKYDLGDGYEQHCIEGKYGSLCVETRKELRDTMTKAEQFKFFFEKCVFYSKVS